MWNIQNNDKCWNHSRGTTGGQDSKKMSRNTYKNVLDVNKTRSNTRKNQENYIYWKFHRDHSRKLASI